MVIRGCQQTEPLYLVETSLCSWVLCFVLSFVDRLHREWFCICFFVKILPLFSPWPRRPAHDERRLRCRGGDGPASHHSPPQGALLWPGGWEQPGVPEGEKHGTWPATGLQHDGAEEEGLHDTPEPGQWNGPARFPPRRAGEITPTESSHLGSESRLLDAAGLQTSHDDCSMSPSTVVFVSEMRSLNGHCVLENKRCFQIWRKWQSSYCHAVNVHASAAGGTTHLLMTSFCCNLIYSWIELIEGLLIKVLWMCVFV